MGFSCLEWTITVYFILNIILCSGLWYVFKTFNSNPDVLLNNLDSDQVKALNNLDSDQVKALNNLYDNQVKALNNLYDNQVKSYSVVLFFGVFLLILLWCIDGFDTIVGLFKRDRN